jgi:hypothetical protein
MPAAPPPPAPLPDFIVRSREEVERLRDDAKAEMELGDWGDNLEALAAGRRVTVHAAHPQLMAEGVYEMCRWLLGERDDGPITREISSCPPTQAEVGREVSTAQDVIERLSVFRPGGPRWQDPHEDYACGVRNTVRWARNPTGYERPISEA